MKVKRVPLIACAIFLSVLAVPLMPAFAGDMAIGEFGIRYHGGAQGKSFSGAMGEFLYFQSNVGKGTIRPNIGASLEFISGTASVGSNTPGGTAWSGGVYPGCDFFPFRTERIQPFVDVHAIASWNYAALSPLPQTSDQTSLGLAFGYEVGGGTDIRFNKNQDRAIRIHTSYSAYSGKICGQPGFQFNAFSMSLGLVF